MPQSRQETTQVNFAQELQYEAADMKENPSLKIHVLLWFIDHDQRIILTNKFFCSQVSWIKRKNVQELLTVGLTTYANDERFQAIHFHHSEDWTLQIKYVQPRDAGLYECQVSTHPPTSIFLFLEVVGKNKILSRN